MSTRAALSRLGRHSAIYGTANVIGASATLILLPVLTRRLGREEYGAFEALTVFGAQLGVLMQLGIGSALFKFALKGEDAGRFIATAFWTMLAFSACALVGLAPAAPLLGQWLVDDSTAGTLVRLTLVKVFADAAGVVPMVRLRMREASIVYGLLTAGRVTLTLLIIIIALAVVPDPLTAVVSGAAAEAVISATIALAVARLPLRGFDRARLRQLLAYGLPLIPYAFMMSLLALGDRYFIRAFGGLEALGIYAVGYKLAAVLGIFTRAFQVAWPAVMFGTADSSEGRRFFAKVLTYIVLLLTTLGVGIALFAPQVTRFVATPAFAPAHVVVPILIVAQLGLGAFYATAVGTNVTGKTYLQAVSAAIALAVFATAAVALVPRFGIVGAAIATAAGYVTLAATDCWFSLRLYPVSYEWGRVAAIVATGALTVTAGSLVEASSVVLDIAFNVALATAYCGLVLALRIVSPSERHAVLSLILRSPRPASSPPAETV